MSRFINPFPQFILSSGSPNSGGFLVFYDTGTTDPKDVYSDSAFSTSIGNTVRLDSSGRIPTIYLNGAYSVALQDKNGNQLDSADPIGVDTVVTAFDDWLSSSTYNTGDIVTGSNGLNYQSTQDSNLNNDPTSTSGFWEQFYFLPTWETTQTYSAGQLAIGSDGNVYQSQAGANSGNDPTLDDGTNWKSLLQSGDDVELGGLTLTKTDATTTGVTFDNDGTTRWVLNFDASENLTLDRYTAGGALIDSSLSFDVSTGEATFANDMTITGNQTLNQDTNAATVSLDMTSDAAQQALIAFQDAGVDRWILGQSVSNSFSLARYNSSGIIQGTPFYLNDGSDNLHLEGNLQFDTTAQGIDVASPNGGVMNFNFPLLSLNTENTAFDFFDNTNTSGDRLVNVYRGDGSSDVTFQIDAEDGSIHPAFDRAGETEPGVKLNKITLSTNSPTGGEDGDLWLRY